MIDKCDSSIRIYRFLGLAEFTCVADNPAANTENQAIEEKLLSLTCRIVVIASNRSKCHSLEIVIEQRNDFNLARVAHSEKNEPRSLNRHRTAVCGRRTGIFLIIFFIMHLSCIIFSCSVVKHGIFGIVVVPISYFL